MTPLVLSDASKIKCMYHFPFGLKLKGDFCFISQMLSSCHFILIKQLIENSFLSMFHALDYEKDPKFIAPFHCVYVLLLRNKITLIFILSTLVDLNFFFFQSYLNF